jgi:hypothetical protein
LSDCKWTKEIIFRLKDFSLLTNNSKLSNVSLKTLHEIFVVPGMRQELDLYAPLIISTSIKAACSHNIIISEEGDKLVTLLFSKFSKVKILKKVHSDYLKNKYKDPEMRAVLLKGIEHLLLTS